MRHFSPWSDSVAGANKPTLRHVLDKRIDLAAESTQELIEAAFNEPVLISLRNEVRMFKASRFIKELDEPRELALLNAHR